MTIVKQPINDNDVITWEVAAYDSTEELYSDINSLVGHSIKNLRETIDSYIDSKTYLDSDGVMTQEHKNRWVLLSSNAIRIAKEFDATYLLSLIAFAKRESEISSTGLEPELS